MQLNPNIILGGRESVPLNGLGETYDNAARIQQHREALQTSQMKNEETRATAEAYRRATGPDGKVDNGMLMSTLAQMGVGRMIPGIQKAGLEAQKTQSEVSGKNMETDVKSAELLYRGLKEVDGAIASLMAKPDANERDVYGEVGRLVRVGAFDMQAKHKGVTPDEFARDLLSTLPVGNPQAMRGWLAQAGMRAADASKRLEVALPKYDEQNRGGVINQGTINQITGERTAGVGPANNPVPTADPNSVLSSETARRGQNIVDNRARETNDINREALQSQIVEGPNGPMVVNKATTLARPVATLDGQPLLNKDSTVAKDARVAKTITGQIAEARAALQEATSSGIGAMVDKGLGVAGISTKSGDAAAKLDTIGAWMTSNVPRFEGPQSNKDTETYQIMAGNVADRTKPMSQRAAALDALETFMAEKLGKPGTAPAAIVVPPPPAAGTGPRLAAPRPGYTGATPIGSRPGQAQPDINQFFRR